MATEIFGGAIIKNDILRVDPDRPLIVEEVFDIHDGVRVVARPPGSKLPKDVEILTFGAMQKVMVD